MIFMIINVPFGYGGFCLDFVKGKVDVFTRMEVGHSMGDAIHSMRNILKAYSASAPLKDESKMINSCFWLVFPVVTSTTAILLNIFVQNRGFKPRNLLGKNSKWTEQEGRELVIFGAFWLVNDVRQVKIQNINSIEIKDYGFRIDNAAFCCNDSFFA